MLKILGHSRVSSSKKFESDIRPTFPNVELLLQQAERCTNSCVHPEQIHISRKFFKAVAIRGAYSKRYTLEEVKRAATLIDYMADVRARQIGNFDIAVGAN